MEQWLKNIQKQEVWLYQNQQLGPLTDARQVRKWRACLPSQAATEPVEYTWRIRAEEGRPVHLTNRS